MTTYPLGNELKEVVLPLEAIFLDPNNPRFTTKDGRYIPDSEIDNPATQDATRKRLIADFGVNKLRISMEINGYLPIDRVIVREFATGKFVVLEGNRRICAAKLVSTYSTDGVTVDSNILHTFTNIPCLQYIGEAADAAWIFQGLRHISGINDWSAFNKAKLLVDQIEEESLTITEVGKRFGLTQFGAGQWARGYYAYKQAAERSDYIDEVDERSYPYFQELFSRSSSAVRDWMEWDNAAQQFSNELNFNEFISWLYPRDPDKSNNEQDGNGSVGEWEKRPLKRRDDIRQLAYLIKEDQKAFEYFRTELDIEQAYAQALSARYDKQNRERQDAEEVFFQTADACLKTMQNIPLRLLSDQDKRSKVLKSINALEQAMIPIKTFSNS